MGVLEELQLKRTAKSIRRRNVVIRGTISVILCLFSILAVTYAISYFFDQLGSFTVKVDNYDMLQAGLTLSEKKGQFDKPISRLDADAIKKIDNISIFDLPKNIDSIDGDHHGSNHVAYTFYLKNKGKATVSYQSSLKISNVKKNLDSAIRFMVFVNGKKTVYAKPKANGKPETGTVPFKGFDTVMEDKRVEFAPDAEDKYTVVIWLEGDDPECLNNLIGGSLKADMRFKIIENS